MQAQSTRNELATTSAQSLVAIQTLLRASLGCITFLRDLLPSDNFTDSHFTSSDDSFLSSQSTDANRSIDSSSGSNKSVNGFKIMTMTRGYTHEADRILNYLEYGIFDALQKRYLRSFIFAIYLNEKDPTNIVEAYTFNFHYYQIPGTNEVIPVMSVGENKRQAGRDPVSIAARSGKAPTLKDVKKSVKTLLKTLIHSTTQMDVLPKRRYAAFKLFYTDETPHDYEPPHFQAGDAQRDKWYFMTHDAEEVPDNWKMGKVDTGHHSVNVSVATIATYLPSSTANENATFTGTVSRPSVAPPLTPLQEVAQRTEQANRQLDDAETRNIVWAAEAAVEGDDDDAIGEDEDASFDHGYRWDMVEGMVLLGRRNDEGVIEPIPAKELQVAPHSTNMDMDDQEYDGMTQPVPTRMDDLPKFNNLDGDNFEQTQPCPGFPEDLGSSSAQSIYRNDSLPPSDILSSSPAGELDTQIDIDTQRLQALALDNQRYLEDSEMLDMETQPQEDPIQSFNDADMEDRIEEDIPTPKPVKVARKKPQVEDRGLQCECDTTIDENTCFCEKCGRWYHIWCMGYHSTEDKRLPDEFICFDCRVQADNSWELIKVNLYPKMLSSFKDLSLFRRAIKVAEVHNPSVVSEFAKLVGCDNILARQLWKRLENEGFIIETSLELDELGFTETRSKAAKSKSKTKGKQRKNVQKAKYTFNHACLTTNEYKDYFDPAAESRLLGLPQKKEKIKEPKTMPPPPPVVDESQTQPETQTQMPAPRSALINNGKRAHEQEAGERPKKKVKISIAPAVDLAE
ncbi:HORMA domain-containing protein [Mycena kentingensis (nom. inval.)]|nr:HORMA domain-containing protein [Mycena kentingensis (nom. inval.)]